MDHEGIKRTTVSIGHGETRPEINPKGKLVAAMGNCLSGTIKAKTHIRTIQGEYGWWQQKTLDPFKAQWEERLPLLSLPNYLQPRKS